jgi:hypothetical protein
LKLWVLGPSWLADKSGVSHIHKDL